MQQSTSHQIVHMCMDNTGQCARACCVFCLRRPHIPFNVCFAHQINLMVGALPKTCPFKQSGDNYNVYFNEKIEMKVKFGKDTVFIIIIQSRQPRKSPSPHPNGHQNCAAWCVICMVLVQNPPFMRLVTHSGKVCRFVLLHSCASKKHVT